MAIIRHAQPSDVHNIQMVVRHNSKCFGFVMECFIAESIRRKECIVVEEGEQIIGFVRFGYLKTKKMTRIHEICIEKEFRGGHFATMLLKRLRRPVIADCPVDNESNRWYMNNGFIFSRRRKPNAKSRVLNEWILY